MKRKNTFSKQLLEQQLCEQGIVKWIMDNKKKAALAADWIYNYAQRNEPHSLERVGKALSDVGADVVNWGNKIWSGVTQGAQEKGVDIKKIPQSLGTDKGPETTTPPPKPYVPPPPAEDEFISKANIQKKLSEKYQSFKQPEKSAFELAVEKNFSDPFTRAAIMAKARHESGGKNVGEYSYADTSNSHIRKVFFDKPKLMALSDAELTALKKNPEAFFDVTYGHLGGFKYRGRGPIQITGRANYARLDKELGLNGALIKDPDMLLRDPELAAQASVQYLKNAGLNKKTYQNQRDAHLAVIHAIGGPRYAPGSPRSELVYAQLMKQQGSPIVTPSNKQLAAKDQNTYIKKQVDALNTPSGTSDKTLDKDSATLPTTKVDTSTTAPDTDAKEKLNKTQSDGEPRYYTGATTTDVKAIDRIKPYIAPQAAAGEYISEKEKRGANSRRQNQSITNRNKNPKVQEAEAAVFDKALDTGKDILSNINAAGWAGAYLPKVPEKAKKLAARVVPITNAPLQAYDVVKRTKMGDPVGAAIAGVSAAPAIPIMLGGMGVQAIRDKARTGSFFPDDEELEKAARKDQARGGYWKARASDYDPSFLPENTQMKRLTNLRLSVIKEEFRLKKCSMTEEQIAERFFYYYDGKHTIFNENGEIIGHVGGSGKIYLNEGVPPWFQSAIRAGIEGTKKGVNFVKSGGIGRALDTTGQAIAAGTERLGKVGKFMIDKPLDAVTYPLKSLLNKAEEINYKLPSGLNPEEKAKAIKDRLGLESQEIINAADRAALKHSEIMYELEQARKRGEDKAIIAKLEAEAKQARGIADEAIAKAQEQQFITKQVKSDTPIFGKREKQLAKIGGIATGVAGATDALLQYDTEKGFKDYVPGAGIQPKIKEIPPVAPPSAQPAVQENKQTISEKQVRDMSWAEFWRWATNQEQPKPAPAPPAPAPAPAPQKIQSNAANWAYSIHTGKNKLEQVPDSLKAEVQGLLNKPPAYWKPEPPKPEPPKPEPVKPDPKKDDDPRLRGDYTVNPDPEAPKVPYTPRQLPDSGGSERVRKMQQKLRDAGYGALLGKFGPEGDGVDGKWGRHTQRAYDAYKADQQAKKEIGARIDTGTGTGITPTVPVKAYLDDYPDLSKIKSATNEPAGDTNINPRLNAPGQNIDWKTIAPELFDTDTVTDPLDPIGGIIRRKQPELPIDWKSRNPDIKGVFESDLKEILRLAGRK